MSIHSSLMFSDPFRDSAATTNGSIDRELAARLRRHVEQLAGLGERSVRRPAALQAAADYVAREWRAQGHDVAVQRYTADGVDCRNLEVTIRGRDLASEIVLAGAHYDTVAGSPGADDNASGVAALLELGRELARAEPRRTLRLAAFVNEEPPFFFFGDMGSKVYARAARRRGDDIRIMLSLEMLGYYSRRPGSQTYPPLIGRLYPNRGDFIGFVSNLRSWPQLKQAVAAFRRSSDFPIESAALPALVPGVGWSDQFSFWREGYRALMVTDTAFHRNPYYHTSADTPDTLDYGSMAAVVEGLAGALRILSRERK
jgi:Zn-dependent M28 family amino/carboxypeptidase